jgi:hypothetical protein
LIQCDLFRKESLSTYEERLSHYLNLINLLGFQIPDLDKLDQDL